MRWGKIGIVALIALLAFGGTLLVVRDGPPPVDALELDDDAVRREDDGADLQIQEADDDDDDTGTRTRTGRRDAGADTTDDGRDGTREGDTRTNGVGTGTGDTGRVVAGGGTNTGGTNTGRAGGGGGTNTGGGTT